MFIFVCYAVPAKSVKENKAVSVPGNKQSLKLLEILKDVYGDRLVCITIPPRQASVKDYKKRSYFCNVPLLEGVRTIEVQYRNLPVLKDFSIRRELYKQLKILCRESSGRHLALMTVNSNACVAVPLIKLKEKYRLRTVIYLSDMPFDENGTKNLVKKLLTLYDNRVRVRALKYYDGCITGVEYMANKYFCNKPYVCIDPALEIEKYNRSEKSNLKKAEIKVVYTGSLNQNYNIPTLIEVFKRLPSHYTITFYGRGVFENDIKNVACKYHNILFGGYLAFDDIVSVQSEADILIALLDTQKNISKYAVPSKVYDYLCTGVPIISSDALSLPNEIKRYMTIVNDKSVDDIMETIIRITEDEAAKNSALKKAESGRAYVKDNCNWTMQRRKIIKFLMENYDE